MGTSWTQWKWKFSLIRYWVREKKYLWFLNQRFRRFEYNCLFWGYCHHLQSSLHISDLPHDPSVTVSAHPPLLLLTLPPLLTGHHWQVTVMSCLPLPHHHCMWRSVPEQSQRAVAAVVAPERLTAVLAPGRGTEHSSPRSLDWGRDRLGLGMTLEDVALTYHVS